MNHIQKTIGSCLFLLSFIVIQIHLFAAPHSGDEYKLKQPNGSLIDVRVWGDEYYQRVETPEGYTLIRDEEGWICYAMLAADATKFVATEAIYNGIDEPSVVTSLNLPKSLRIDADARNAQANAMLHKLEADEEGVNLIRFGKVVKTRAPQKTIKGLTILIDFSDEPAAIDRAEINDFSNKEGYNGFGCNGSVYDYFKDVSGGKLYYTNVVQNYYRARNPKSYYDTGSGYSRARELAYEAINAINNRGFNYSTLSVNDNDRVLAVNILYAGKPEAGWANGLWPHSGSISNYNTDGVTVRKYQMTNIGTSLKLGTFCHENGHMICGFPDLYDKNGGSAGTGAYCIMSRSSGNNPKPPCAPLRDYYVGWDTVTNITYAAAGTQYSLRANSNNACIYKNPRNSNEAFYIEARRKKDRSTTLTDEGLLIWHWDREGNNDDEQMTSSDHFRVSIEQADGLYNLENNNNSGDANDLFDKSSKHMFNDNTSPNAHWWNGSRSEMKIANISEIGDVMTFTIDEASETESVAATFKKSIAVSNKELFIHTVSGTPVSIAIFDLQGRRITRSIQKAAKDVVRFSLQDDLVGGSYVYEVKIGLETVRGRIVLSR